MSVLSAESKGQAATAAHRQRRLRRHRRQRAPRAGIDVCSQRRACAACCASRRSRLTAVCRTRDRHCCGGTVRCIQVLPQRPQLARTSRRTQAHPSTQTQARRNTSAPMQNRMHIVTVDILFGIHSERSSRTNSAQCNCAVPLGAWRWMQPCAADPYG